MAIRFTITDHDAALTAMEQLPAALRELDAAISAAGQPIRDSGDTVAPADALDALVHWQRSQPRIERARAEVLRLLNLSGATPRGLATALTCNRSTVDRLIKLAEAELDQS